MDITTPSEEELEAIRPKHIDFQVLCIAANTMDDCEDSTELLVRMSKYDLEEIMDLALKQCFDLAAAKGDPASMARYIMGIGNFADYSEYYAAAWLRGMTEGLEEKRDLELPDDWATKSDFWDLDGDSVTYMIKQRVIRAVVSYVNETDAHRHPMVVSASLWMDGYSAGLQFDNIKEALIK